MAGTRCAWNPARRRLEPHVFNIGVLAADLYARVGKKQRLWPADVIVGSSGIALLLTVLAAKTAWDAVSLPAVKRADQAIEAYNSWDRRRQQATPNTPDSIDGVIDNKGFTGHEMLDQIDLVHMNGRVYDPFVARFMSADQIIQAPEHSQSYNRYTYVWNNPTNLTDPTGFEGELLTEEQKRQARANKTATDCWWAANCTYMGPGVASSLNGGEARPRTSADNSGNAGRANSANIAPATQTYVGMGKDGVPYTYEGPAAEPKSTTQKIKDGVGDFVEGAMHAAEGIPGEGIAFAGVVKITRTATSTVIGALERTASGLSGLSFGEMRTALTTAQDSYKGSTVIGHALSKHAGRNPQIWGRIAGSMKTWNDQAMKQFREIVRAPGEFEEKAYDGIKFLEKRLEDGRGVRLNMDSTFKGFID